MAPQFMMTWWGVLDDLVERPRYRGVMCWMMGVPSAMSLWVVLDDLVEHSRCRSGSCWMRAGGNAGTVVCNSAFLHTARPKTAAPCAIPRFYTPRDPKTSFGVQFHVFAHRKAQNRRPVCNSTFLHTARPENVVRCAIPPFCTPQGRSPDGDWASGRPSTGPKCRFQRLSASASPQNALSPRLHNPKAFF